MPGEHIKTLLIGKGGKNSNSFRHWVFSKLVADAFLRIPPFHRTLKTESGKISPNRCVV